MPATNLYASVGVFAQARQYGARARVVYERRGMLAAVGWTYYSDGCWTDEEGDEVAALHGLTRALAYAAAAAQYGEAVTVGASLDEEEWRYRQAFTGGTDGPGCQLFIVFSCGMSPHRYGVGCP